MWIAAGAAMALVLYEPAQVVLVKQFGAHATRAITTLTLVAGFASTIFQPLTAVLADHLGWRTALVVLAVALAVITIPVHLVVLPAHRRRPDHVTSVGHAARTPTAPSAAHRRLHPGDGRPWPPASSTSSPTSSTTAGPR